MSMAKTILDELMENSPVLLDGAWGTQLQARGLAVGDSPERWNLTNPEAVTAVARAYAEAGSRIVLTNTFGGNRYILSAHGLEKEVSAINRNGVALTREGIGPGVAVFASLGPSGKLLSMGEADEEELAEVFREQVRGFVAGGANGVVVETMSDLAEAELAVRVAVESSLPVVACMSYSAGKDMDRTIMGITPEAAADALLAAGASYVGANCGNGAAQYAGVCGRLHKTSGRPVWLKPNAGVPEVVEGEVVYRTTPESFARDAHALAAEGAGFLGGCCGTTPDHIRVLGAVLRGVGS